jgi:hypothetical protein
MLDGYKKRTNIGVGFGLLGQILGRMLIIQESQGAALGGLLLMLVGLVAFVWGAHNTHAGKVIQSGSVVSASLV